MDRHTNGRTDRHTEDIATIQWINIETKTDKATATDFQLSCFRKSTRETSINQQTNQQQAPRMYVCL